jgi:hypothetical protein
MKERETKMLDLNVAIRHLELQGISVSPGMIGLEGFVFDVGGFLLSGSQILKLQRKGQLTLRGIKEFTSSNEYDVISGRRPN